MERVVEALWVIGIYGLPGELMLIGAALVGWRAHIDRGPKWLLVGSMVAFGVGWIYSWVYWWLAICWETWSPCDGDVEPILGWGLVEAGATGLIVGGVWAVVKWRGWKAVGIGAAAIAMVGVLIAGVVLVVGGDDGDEPGLPKASVKNVIRPHLKGLKGEPTVDCEPTDSTDFGLWRCWARTDKGQVGRSVLIRVRPDGSYSSPLTSGCCVVLPD